MKGLKGGLKGEFNALKDEAKETVKFREALLGEEDFSKQLEMYKKGFEGLSEAQKAVIGDEFKALGLLYDSYVDTGKNILEGVDLSTEAGNTLSQKLGLEDTEKLFKRVATLMKTTTRANAWGQAISELLTIQRLLRPHGSSHLEMWINWQLHLTLWQVESIILTRSRKTF